MTFDQYEAATGENLSALAARLDLNKGHLHKIASGERGWNSETALLIKRGTQSLITPNDLADIREKWLRGMAKSRRA